MKDPFYIIRKIGFIILILLATCGIALPIPIFPTDEFEITAEMPIDEEKLD